MKGIAISLPENQALLKVKDSSVARRLFHHTLHKLAIEAGVTLTPSEELMCERLEQYTVWAGRYPTPKQASAMMPRYITEDSFVPLTYQMDTDFEEIRALIRKLRGMLTPLDYTETLA